MTLVQIQYALAVFKAGSMNKAAEQLFISQPALTSAIRSLEEELNLQIFIRRSHGIQATNEGMEFLMYARQALQQFELLQERFGADRPVKKKFYVSCQHYSFATKAFVELAQGYGLDHYDFAIKECRTMDVIRDVASSISELGILFRSRFNYKYLNRLLAERNLSFHPLIHCQAYVYLYKEHPLAQKEVIVYEDLLPYPNMGFDQGEEGSLYLAEEIMVDGEFPRTIRVADRATMLNLMRGLFGFTLCSGVICEELNGDDYVAVPYQAQDSEDALMEIGYIHPKRSVLSNVGQDYVRHLKDYLGKSDSAQISNEL